jgi:hypothetical protein
VLPDARRSACRGRTSVSGKSTVIETDLIDDDGDGTIDRRVVTVVPL